MCEWNDFYNADDDGDSSRSHLRDLSLSVHDFLQ
jgi:hypothetical protein